MFDNYGASTMLDETINPPIVRAPLRPSQAGELASKFKALGDPVRLRLLSMIASTDQGEICVCELTCAFELTAPTISHHLKVLREAGLVDGDRRGTWIYYRLQPNALAMLANLLDVADGPVVAVGDPPGTGRSGDPRVTG